jgi:DNA-binding transcriptional LysR family regulator
LAAGCGAVCKIVICLSGAAGLRLQIAFTSPSLELVRGMVGQGLGYSILVTRPQGDLTYDGKHLEVRPLSDANTASSIVSVSRADLRQTRLVAGFESLALSLTSTDKTLI